jgi:NADPH:quinone reductase-like Zn-dependent oxidoreductase
MAASEMQAVVYEQGATALKLVTKTCPKAGCQEHVLVRVNCAGLNPVDAKGVYVCDYKVVVAIM